MCGRFVLMTVGKDLAGRFGLEEVPDLRPRYNIAPTQIVVIIRVDRDTLQKRFAQVKWGLIPFWAKDTATGNRLINARGESAAEKPAFRAAFKSRRCLVLSDGFYQWTKGKVGKQPYSLEWLMEAPLLMPVFGRDGKDPKTRLSNPVRSSPPMPTS